MAIHQRSVRTVRRATPLRLAAAVGSVLAVAVLGAPAGDAVSSGSPPTAADATPPSGEPPEPGADPGSVPPVAWHGCGRDVPGASKALQCATYQVPLDHRDPRAGTATIALDRLPATGPNRIGSLFLNPGGPGGSGVDFVAGVGTSPIFTALRKRFDLVGFDPRGTNRSTPSIRCEPTARTVRRLDRAVGRPDRWATG